MYRVVPLDMSGSSHWFSSLANGFCLNNSGKTPKILWFLIIKARSVAHFQTVMERHLPRFYMNNKHGENDGHDGQREVAVLSFRCRPTHYMNLAIKMRRAEDVKFVEGELRSLVFLPFRRGCLDGCHFFARSLHGIRTLKKPSFHYLPAEVGVVQYLTTTIWRFPKLGVPLNHQF